MTAIGSTARMTVWTLPPLVIAAMWRLSAILPSIVAEIFASTGARSQPVSAFTDAAAITSGMSLHLTRRDMFSSEARKGTP